jgi:hypothetical protein
MVKPGDEILVAFGIDEGFACHLGVTITSIIRTAPRERFRFLVAHGGVSDETKRKVESCATAQRFEWHQVTDNRLPNSKSAARWRKARVRYGSVLCDLMPSLMAPRVYRSRSQQQSWRYINPSWFRLCRLS